MKSGDGRWDPLQVLNGTDGRCEASSGGCGRPHACLLHEDACQCHCDSRWARSRRVGRQCAKPRTVWGSSTGTPRYDGAFIQRTAFIDARHWSAAVGKVCEQGGCAACTPPPYGPHVRGREATDTGLAYVSQVSGPGGGGGPVVRASGGTVSASGAPLGSHAGCSAGSLHSAGSRRGSIPLGASAIEYAPRHPELSPHEAVPKSSLASSSVACCWSVCLALPAEPAYLVAYADWVDAVRGATRQLLPRVHDVVGDLAFGLNRMWNLADFYSPHLDVGF